MTTEAELRRLLLADEVRDTFSWLSLVDAKYEDYTRLYGEGNDTHIGLVSYTGLLWDGGEASIFIQAKRFGTDAEALSHIEATRPRLVPGISEEQRASSFKDITADQIGDISYRAREDRARAVMFKRGNHVFAVGANDLDISSAKDFEVLAGLATLVQDRLTATGLD